MEEKDLEVTFIWRNDPDVLKYAQAPNQVSMAEHAAVFKFNNSLKLIFEFDSQPIGFVSVTRDPNEPKGEWSFHLAKEFRGKGLSELMLRMTLHYLKTVEKYKIITSSVMPDNIVSNYLHHMLEFVQVHGKDDKFKEYYLYL